MTHLFLALALLAQAPAVADDSPALNAAIRAVATAGGGTVQLEPRTYGIGAALDGSAPNVTLRGVPGATRLVKLPLPSTDGITSLGGYQTYRGWRFSGIAFDGSGREILAGGIAYYFSLPFSGSRDLRFDRCTFRDLVRGVIVRDSEGVAFEGCTFLGTSPGVFAGGTWDPPAVPGFAPSGALEVTEQCRDVTISRCRFRFVEHGISVPIAPTQTLRNLAVSGCSFVSDWWDTPFVTLRFMPAAARPVPGGFRLTRPAGGLGAAFGSNEVVSFRRDLAAGKEFTRLYAGNVAVDTTLGAAVPGDSIETIDGRRARIGAIEGPAAANVEGWESIADYSPCDPPAPSTPWRLVRYYAAVTAPVSDTEVACGDPVCPYTGEQAVADVGMDLTRHAARALAKASYGGVHVNAGVEGLSVRGNTFRGGWADQCSVFNCPSGAIVSGNWFFHGQDEGITLTGCPNSVVSGNRFVGCGVSAVFLGNSDGTAVTGNVVRDWGLTNPNVAAVDCWGGRGLSISGNAFAVTPTPKPRDRARWCVGLREADCTGTTIAGNTDGGSTVATLSADLKAAPKKAAVTARDLSRGVVGTGKANVRVTP
jgi:parallel beta-helix repeat protein